MLKKIYLTLFLTESVALLVAVAFLIGYNLGKLDGYEDFAGGKCHIDGINDVVCITYVD